MTTKRVEVQGQGNADTFSVPRAWVLTGLVLLTWYLAVLGSFGIVWLVKLALAETGRLP